MRNKARVKGTVIVIVAFAATFCLNQYAAAESNGVWSGGGQSDGGEERAGSKRGGEEGGRRGGMLSSMSWSAIAFEVKATSSQLEALRPAFQAAWDARKTMKDKMRVMRESGSDDREAMGEAMQNLHTESQSVQEALEARINEVLSPEQLAVLEEWKTSMAEARSSHGGRAGGKAGKSGGKSRGGAGGE